MDRAVGVRRLTPADVAVAQRTLALIGAVFEEPTAGLSADYVRGLLSRPEFWLLAALDGDAPVGGLTAHALPMTHSETSELFLYDLAVAPERQRRGIGRALVEALLAEGRAAGIGVAFVPADDEDRHALDFYRALGGQPSPVTFFTFESA